MKPKRNIEDLQPHEAVEVSTIKQAKKLLGWVEFQLPLPVYLSFSQCPIISEHQLGRSKVIYPATDYLPKKSKKASKKWVLEQIKQPIQDLYNTILQIKEEKFNEDLEKLEQSSIKLLEKLKLEGICNIKVKNAETVGGELEVGRWYNSVSGALWFITKINRLDNTIESYGFGQKGIWSDLCVRQLREYTPATPEQVKSALIKEAERRYPAKSRVDSLGGAKDVPAYPYEFSFKYMPELNILRTSDDCLLFDNGKWAEIIEQPKEIDFSVPGQLLSCNNSTLVVMTSGNHESTTFSGFVISDYDSVQKYKIGHYSNDWSKSKFKPYTGEPIILKP